MFRFDRGGAVRAVVCALGFGALAGLTSAAPARASFVEFESGQVRPLALSPDKTRLFAVNTPDARLEIFNVDTNGDLTHAGSVPVGMEPVAVAARSNTEVWVVNHLSDSVSIVDVGNNPPKVVRTLLVGDEPRDIVITTTTSFGERVFVTTAHRGQNTPLQPTIDTELRTAGIGRADVWAFDPTNLGATLEGTPLSITTLFGDTPRALAVSPDGNTVYVAVFHSGNQTTTISEGIVCDGGTTATSPCNTPDGIMVTGGLAGGKVPGGLPPPDTNFQGTPYNETGLIVKYNNASNHWEDNEMPPRNWTNGVRFKLPDHDVFTINANSASPAETGTPFDHVGTVLFNMVANPVSGKVYVSNTDANNLTRFEGPGTFGGSTVRGHLAEAHITVLDGSNVIPRHLNKHITAALPSGYDSVPMPADVKGKSFATPTQMVVTNDGNTLYVAAFGSSAVGKFDTAQLEANTFVPSTTSHIPVAGGGPSGLVLNEAKNRLYVLTRFDNAVGVIDTTGSTEIAHLPFFNPEPPNVVNGRHFLYDAQFTSSNGEASCSSCHIFADFDSLGWDLGNPDDIVKTNPNPAGPVFFAQNFHPMKGPMTTQTLRGMANHGPMHWRGDRTGAYSAPNSQPNSGGYDEQAAFNAFNVAFPGLIGRDIAEGNQGQLLTAEMQAFTDFILEVTLPPNPIRKLDNSLTGPQTNGSNFFNGPTSDTVTNCNGCHTLNVASGFFGTDGRSTFENETQEFKVPHLRNLYQKIGMFGMPKVNFLGSGDNPPTTADNGFKGNQIRGFGFLHDGSTDTLFRFHRATVFTFPGGDAQRRDVESFMFAFDTNLAPIVGQQTTLTDTNAGIVDVRINLLVARATAQECDVIVKGPFNSEDRGWVYDTNDSLFHSDRANETQTLTDLHTIAGVAGQNLTFTCVPPGSGQRAGIDRDEDGYLDRDELDQGSDPADPGSIPGTPTPTATPTSTATATATPTIPSSQCGATPPPVCHTPGKGRVVLRVSAGKESIVWKWLKGDTDLSALGNPVSGTTSYSLCMYDSTQSLIMDVGPLVQGVCDGGACFTSSGQGFRYKDKPGTNDGAQKATLKSGTGGKAKMIVKGKGGNLPVPTLPQNGLTLPVEIVWQNSGGECWATTFTGATKNDDTIFKAKF